MRDSGGAQFDQHQTSMDQNLIFDPEGQMDDYFNADRNPFTRMSQEGSIDDLGNYLNGRNLQRQQTGDLMGENSSNNDG